MGVDAICGGVGEDDGGVGMEDRVVHCFERDVR